VHYLILYIIFMQLFSQTLRYSQRRGAGVLAVSAVNYVVAAAVSAVVLAGWWWSAGLSVQRVPLALGAVTGTLYFVNLLIMLAAYRLVGVGITAAFSALGVVVPVIVSWYAWREQMTALRWAAVALLPVAVVLMRPSQNGRHRITFKADLILVSAFLVPGVVGTLHKALNVYAPGAGRNLYQAALFAAAALSSVAYARWRRARYDRPVIVLGSVLGVSNVLATLFVLLSLSVMQAVVFYPMSASLVIASSVVVSWLLWRERVTRRQVVGLLFAVCIVILARL